MSKKIKIDKKLVDEVRDKQLVALINDVPKKPNGNILHIDGLTLRQAAKLSRILNHHIFRDL